MSLFCCPVGHAENPPETWSVEKIAPRTWVISTGVSSYARISSYGTKRAAQDAIDYSWAPLYNRETAWYEGSTLLGWRPYEPRPCKNHPTVDEHAFDLDEERFGPQD